MKKYLSLIALAAILASNNASARDQIRAVGSSTVYPFATMVAEHFGKGGKFKTPVIESTGTGGGMKLFCAGAGEETPDIEDASRKIELSEIDMCRKNGVKSISEIKIGFDGIVFADSKDGKPVELTRTDIFKALAKKVAKDGKLVDNPYQTWNQVNPKLPNEKIEVYGPPPTSGTRDSFVELVMVTACDGIQEFRNTYPDKKEREKACGAIREDGKYIEAGENDNLIVQKLQGNPSAFGIFGYSYLDQNRSKIRGNKIDGYEPTFENISGGKYPISRPLFIYAKLDHVGMVPGIKEYIDEFTNEKAIGEFGYLTSKGLIPLAKGDLTKTRKAALAGETIYKD